MGNYTGKWVVARKSFGYAGSQRYIGEVFQLKGMRNDDAIWGITVEGHPKLGRYTEPFAGNSGSLPRCAECGKTFRDHSTLETHGNKMHGGK